MKRAQQINIPLLIILLSLLLPIVVLTGCNGITNFNYGTTPAPDSQQVLRLPIGPADFVTLDPALVQDATDIGAIQVLFTGLVQFNDHGLIKDQLAASHSVSPDGLTFTNHHVAQVCIHGLSGQRGTDFMKTGFYAKTRAEEAKCPDLELNQLVSQYQGTVGIGSASKRIRRGTGATPAPGVTSSASTFCSAIARNSRCSRGRAPRSATHARRCRRARRGTRIRRVARSPPRGARGRRSGGRRRPRPRRRRADRRG